MTFIFSVPYSSCCYGMVYYMVVVYYHIVVVVIMNQLDISMQIILSLSIGMMSPKRFRIARQNGLVASLCYVTWSSLSPTFLCFFRTSSHCILFSTTYLLSKRILWIAVLAQPFHSSLLYFP